MTRRFRAIASFLLVCVAASGDGWRALAQAPADAEGFISLFNGKDLTGWKVPAGDGGHWKVVDGVIDYDAQSQAGGDKSLPTEREFEDFVLRLEWRIKETPYVNKEVRIILPDGSHKKGPDGQDVKIAVPDSDSGVYLRGFPKAQVNIWCWPVGSGEVYGYRMDAKMPPEVRAGVTPRVLADKNVGEWNAFEITLRGDRLSVDVNGRRVIENAQLPGIPARGPVVLQHHGAKKGDEWTSPPSLVQFRNIRIKPLTK
jgi:hypothetical protein